MWVTIETSHVEINLGGYSLSQHRAFYQQGRRRASSCSSSWPTNSSEHQGIYGMEASELVLQDLKIHSCTTFRY